MIVVWVLAAWFVAAVVTVVAWNIAKWIVQR